MHDDYKYDYVHCLLIFQARPDPSCPAPLAPSSFRPTARCFLPMKEEKTSVQCINLFTSAAQPSPTNILVRSTQHAFPHPALITSLILCTEYSLQVLVLRADKALGNTSSHPLVVEAKLRSATARAPNGIPCLRHCTADAAPIFPSPGACLVSPAQRGPGRRLSRCGLSSHVGDRRILYSVRVLVRADVLVCTCILVRTITPYW